MPIYMDRHDLPEAVTAEAVAKAHQEDLKIQDQFGCRGLTYWFDEKRGTAFCLIEAPEEKAVKDMHDKAHGMIPNQILEVDSKVVNAFLGRIENPVPSTDSEELESNIINESAFRTIMVSSLTDFVILKAKSGKDKVYSFLEFHNNIIRNAITCYEGREVKCLRDGFIISFSSATKALDCAKEIMNQMKRGNDVHAIPELKIKIGMSTGPPVNKSPELFGQTVHLAQRLCDVARSGRILISSETKEQILSEWPDALDNIEMMALSPENEFFLNNLTDITESVWNETGFTVQNFGRQLGLSKAQLYRKITKLSGYSPNDFVKEYRLKKAAEAIEKKEGNVSEIAYGSGFSSPSYFSKCFLERFGILPSSLATAIA